MRVICDLLLFFDANKITSRIQKEEGAERNDKTERETKSGKRARGGKERVRDGAKDGERHKGKRHKGKREKEKERYRSLSK